MQSDCWGGNVCVCVWGVIEMCVGVRISNLIWLKLGKNYVFREREIICWIALAGRLWHLQCAAYTLTTVCVCVCKTGCFYFCPCMHLFVPVCECACVCYSISCMFVCVCVLAPVNQLAVTNHYSCGSKLPLWLMSLRTHCISELSAKMDRPFPQFNFLLFSFFLVVIFLLLTLPPTRCLTLFFFVWDHSLWREKV